MQVVKAEQDDLEHQFSQMIDEENQANEQQAPEEIPVPMNDEEKKRPKETSSKSLSPSREPAFTSKLRKLELEETPVKKGLRAENADLQRDLQEAQDAAEENMKAIKDKAERRHAKAIQSQQQGFEAQVEALKEVHKNEMEQHQANTSSQAFALLQDKDQKLLAELLERLLDFG